MFYYSFRNEGSGGGMMGNLVQALTVGRKEAAFVDVSSDTDHSIHGELVMTKLGKNKNDKWVLVKE